MPVCSLCVGPRACLCITSFVCLHHSEVCVQVIRQKPLSTTDGRRRAFKRSCLWGEISRSALATARLFITWWAKWLDREFSLNISNHDHGFDTRTYYGDEGHWRWWWQAQKSIQLSLHKVQTLGDNHTQQWGHWDRNLGKRRKHQDIDL